MQFTDSHTHIYLDQFDEDRSEMMDRALKQNIHRMLLPNIDLDSIEPIDQLVKANPSTCFPMMGLHPCSVKEDWEEVLAKMHERLLKDKYIAVGEIGMDLYWDKSFVEQQKEAFIMQIDWAKEQALPIVIHARDAFEEIFEVLDTHCDERLTGVFHCFSGGDKEAEKIKEYGQFYFGIGGVATFKNSGVAETLKKCVPVDQIMLETDAPYLAPVPFRGKRNEPAYVNNIVEKMLEVYEITTQDLSSITEKNVNDLFKLV